jgi:hypothetical protein
MFHDLANNTIIIQGLSTTRTITIIKKFGAPTKRLEVLVCYDFHYGISNEKEDLMFATEPRLFSIKTIAILTSLWLDQPIKLITSRALNLVEQVIYPIKLVLESPISFDVPIKLVLI